MLSRFVFSFVLASASLFSLIHCAPAKGEDPVAHGSSGYKNVAYFVNWAIYGRNYQPQQLPASQLTHVLYAFANLKTDGTVYLSDTYADLDKHYPSDSWSDVGNNVYGCIKQLFILKKRNRHMKTLLSVGGWTYSTNFAAVASSASSRKQFAATCVEFIKNLGFDGIDIDWEYPNTQTQASDFVLLLAELRRAMDAYAAQYANGYHFQITVACPAGPSNYNIMHMKDMDAYLDAWHLMAYDYSGSWDKIAGHDANIFSSSSNPESTPFNTQRAVVDYVSAGVPAIKILLGMPLYGRSFLGAGGVGKSYSTVGSGSWENGVWDYKVLPKAGAQEYFDAEAAATYSYDSATQELISYDTPAMVKIKAQYIQAVGLGGAMFWETSGDKTGSQSLIGALSGSLGNLESTLNCLTYPVSTYANMVDGMPGE